MKILTLVENTPGAQGCLFEHGLSIYAETVKHKILVDTGASDAFLKNAELLGVDLTQVDVLVLSHGHYDHAGGIMDFVKINPHAPIYMRNTASEGYYHVKEDSAGYIGIDERIRELPQVILTGESLVIDEELSLISGVTERRLWPQGNMGMKHLVNGEYVQDTFDHEQSLVIRSEGESVLISGCAHNGILNILEKYGEIYGGMPDKVITGFHMKKKEPLNAEEICVVKETAHELSRMQGTKFYSGHCTGRDAFDIMKEIMGEQLVALHSGEWIEEMDMNQPNKDKDIDELIAILDGFVASGGSRLKIDVTEGNGGIVDKKYHHGRCDIGSPWAKGTAFDLCE